MTLPTIRWSLYLEGYGLCPLAKTPPEAMRAARAAIVENYLTVPVEERCSIEEWLALHEELLDRASLVQVLAPDIKAIDLFERGLGLVAA